MEISLIPIYDGAPNYLDSLYAIENAGYTVSGLYAVNRDTDLRAIELDCVCARRDISPAILR
jgi:hypothetical protein